MPGHDSFKIDLHTHSIASDDGGITSQQYKKIINSGLLNYVAITDHNRIDFALELQKQMPESIIVGEEIMTSAGEIIGLYLKELVRPGLSPQETIRVIKDQGGIVYIPHPFETVRKGLHPAVLDEIIEEVDIIEICNGRAFFQNKSSQAVVWAKINSKISAASSDAHGFYGIGSTYTAIGKIPTRNNLLQLLSSGVTITDRPTVRALLYPKYNRFMKKLKGINK